MKTIIIYAVITVFFLSCKDSPLDSTPTQFDGRITYTLVTQKGNGFIYSDIIVVGGRENPKKLSSAEKCYSRRPNITRDGRKIAFISCGTFLDDIYIVNSDGSGQRNITSDQAIEEFPTWSPDGANLAYQSFKDGFRDIYAWAEQGENVIKLTESGGSYWIGCWSNDSKQLVYYGREDVSVDEWHIYAVRFPDGTRKRLTTGTGRKMIPAITSDGLLIAYQRNWRLHFLSSDGLEDNPVLSAPDSVVGEMQWSPDGDFLVFQGFVDGRSDLYRINRDGSGLMNLTSDSFEASYPVFSPDNGEIAYIANMGSVYKIYLMDFNGQNKRALTTSNQEEVSPSWGK